MIKEYERELNELQESKLISKEDLQEGDEIVYNGEHYFVTLTDTGTDYVWITDDEFDRYNRNAQGWTLKADWIDEVIGQPEEDELKESLTKSDRDIILDVVKGKYETGHGYLEDKGDYEEALGRRLTDAKYEQLEEFYSDLMDLGPEGFYEEYKDMLDFDPDFIAEYGYSEDDEEEDELEESLKESTKVKERIKNLKDGEVMTISVPFGGPIFDKLKIKLVEKEKIDKNNIFYNIVINNNIVGEIGLSFFDDISAIGLGSFEIKKSERNKGYGTATIRYIINKYKNKYERIYCYVKKTNTKAIEFYSKIGTVHKNITDEDGSSFLVDLYNKEEAQPYIDSNLNSKQDLKESTMNESDKSDKLEESLKEDSSMRKERYRKFNKILALRAADTDEQKEAIKAIESTLDSLGIKAHYGTSTGQPKTVIFDVDRHYNAIYVHADGTVLIGGEEEGEVDPDNKEEVKQMLIDYGFIGNGINESWKDFAFIVKCNDGPKELVRVVADNKSKAEKYAKDMYAANHTTYADDRYNVWSIEDKNEIIKEDINMTRKEMIDWIEDHWNDTVEHGEWLYGYLTELGFNVEDDSDEEEGFYANLTTGDLRKIIDELKPNTKVSVKEQIANIREALETLGKVSDVSLDYTGAEEATLDVDFKDGDTFRIQIYKM